MSGAGRLKLFRTGIFPSTPRQEKGRHMKVLVINAGSSSCKYQLLEMDTQSVLCSGLAERIGQTSGRLTHKIAPDTDKESKLVREAAFPTHVEAMELVIALLTDPLPGGDQRWGCIGTFVAVLGMLFLAAFLFLLLTGGTMLLAL